MNTTLKFALPVAGLVVLAVACGRNEPARDAAMPEQAVAKSAAAALSETPPNERPSESATAPRPGPAGFDCKRARAGADTIVCGDINLAALDREMTRLYGLAETQGPADTLHRLQGGWMAKREACVEAGDPTGCLKAAYAGRIHDLRAGYEAARNDTGGISQGQDWTCPDGVKLSATFLNTFDAAVYVTSGDTRIWMPRAVSASGARYEGGGYELWVKGREASFRRPDAPVTTCTITPL
ncbi:MliC family protein [Asticcacaulis sp. BYS171W]|uniref:MliC family protein n=1 Tax=Asticcacaulis aquaticus TaxID=2984212 RepID=A0ABT5HRC3_9CAUL|nr:MliC family protein [Asticcacaulis aquaticus]MDC7682622.1 MliC family protein [Asticcacaulis aquaticus]